MNLDNYAPVADRLALFWADNPNGRIVTEIIVDDGTRIVFRSAIYRDIADDRPVATGFAEEIRGSSNVNRTSALENAETSAVGRALSNWKYQASTERPSREEMVKVARYQADGIATGPKPVGEPPTAKQLGMLKALGSTAKPTTKREASELIDRIKAEQPRDQEEPW